MSMTNTPTPRTASDHYQRMVRSCVTHHYACDCREALMSESVQTQRRVIDWRDQSAEGLRLRCGELNAQEIRTIRAVLNAILPPHERELDSSKDWNTAAFAATSMASATIARLESERDQLIRVVDELARQSPGDDKWLMSDYRDLPHVRARKKK